MLLIFSPALVAQKGTPAYLSFEIDQKEVVWAQVYDFPQPAERITPLMHDFLKRKAWIRNISVEGDEILADLVNFRVDYKRYGGKYMNTSALIRGARWTGKVRVNFKDGKYRVVVYGLHYDARQPTTNTGKMRNEAHMIHGTWTDWVLNNYRTAFRKKRQSNMDFMHFSLKDMFTMSAQPEIAEDW